MKNVFYTPAVQPSNEALSKTFELLQTPKELDVLQFEANCIMTCDSMLFGFSAQEKLIRVSLSVRINDEGAEVEFIAVNRFLSIDDENSDKQRDLRVKLSEKLDAGFTQAELDDLLLLVANKYNEEFKEKFIETTEKLKELPDMKGILKQIIESIASSDEGCTCEKCTKKAEFSKEDSEDKQPEEQPEK